MNHLEDGRNTEEVTVQPRSAERTTTPQSSQSKSSTTKTSQKSTPSSNPNDLFQYCLASAKETSDLPPLSPNLLAQSNQKLAFLPSVRRPKRTIDFPLCEHLAKQDKYTASIPADWLTKAQLKELVSRQYLTPDSDWTLRLNRNYIIKQLSLKEAKEQYPQQYERSI